MEGPTKRSALVVGPPPRPPKQSDETTIGPALGPEPEPASQHAIGPMGPKAARELCNIDEASATNKDVEPDQTDRQKAAS